ncbi:MAG: DUF2155 domain-containing protein [Rickettsiales bacterium]|nr:DUF2155 domain-containing protein [Rickettsiales bacterium]
MRLTALALALFLPAASWAATADTAVQSVAAQDLEELTPSYNVAILQGLDKVTGNISTIEGMAGTVMRFGNLEIIVRRCWKAPPEERPENAALLDISELKPGEGAQRIFLGWMFSSSPALSALQHPVYDISVIECSSYVEPEPVEKIKEKPKKPAPEKVEKIEKPAKKPRR